MYLTALVLDEGENAADLMATLPQGGGIEGVFVRNPDRTLGARPDAAVAAFYGCCPAEVAAAAVARLCPQRAATLRQPATVAAWRTVPSTYVRCLRDAVVTPAMQDVLAARCDDVRSLDTDHSPFLGAPAELAGILADYSLR